MNIETKSESTISLTIETVLECDQGVQTPDIAPEEPQP